MSNGDETTKIDHNKWEFYVDDADEHRWRVRDANNGKILFICSEGYVNLADAQNCARRAGWAEA